MNEKEPNDKQKELIESTDGIYLADAGPGTGKTFTISLRYAHLLKRFEPKDILLITFTNNAAENMKERIINTSDYDKSKLRDAPITTFHSYCNKLLNRYGHEAPQIIGIDDRVTQSTRIIENEILEKREFDDFMSEFIDDHPEYQNYFRILYDKSNLLVLIKSLGAKGIFPTKEGWFRNSERYLDGDQQRFEEMFDEMNETIPGANGPKQSRLRKKLNGYKNKCFLPNAPPHYEVRDEKQVPEKYKKICFEEDRRELKQFVHDVYFEYIEYALSRNYLNFSFMMMLAFALLCEDHALREKVSFDQIMIDEFQDTNEIQFKLALLLSNTGNICAVGDWKQSIFSFQYASVENITRFEERLEKFKEDLNSDRERIDYPVEVKDEIKLKKNYRSTQPIIDFSSQGLLVEATKNESIDQEEIRSKITDLDSVDNDGQTEISAYKGEDEKKVILSKISEIVNNEDYLLPKDGRKIQYSDIAVLTRTRKFGLKLLDEAEDHDFPVAYEGGIELFRTKPALLLLAWMRVSQNLHSKRGWSVILDEAGYDLEEIESIFSKKSYPEDMFEFRKELKREETVGSVAKKVFDKYSINDAFSDKIIEVLQTTYDNTYFNREDMIDFIVDNIESKETYEVDSTTEDDVFNIQTIHSAKGLEYPVVILADLNPTGGGGFGGAIEFREPIGLRQNKIFSEEDHPYSYDNWKYYVMSKCLSGEYDEERRLLYVSMSRAENYLFLTAEEDNESQFFKNLGIEPERIEPDLRPSIPKQKDRTELSLPSLKEHAPVKYSAHSVIDESCFKNEEFGMGTEYGSRVHNFAEMYVDKGEIEPDNEDEENVKQFIDGLDGEILTEEVCLLPIENHGRRLLFEGKIDLLHIEDNKIQIVDYKTDRNRSAEQEYFKQLSIYYHAVKGVYPDKEVEPYIFYTGEGEKVNVEIRSIEDIQSYI